MRLTLCTRIRYVDHINRVLHMFVELSNSVSEHLKYYAPSE